MNNERVGPSLATYNYFQKSKLIPEDIWDIIPITKPGDVKGNFYIKNVRKGDESRPKGLKKCFPHCVDVSIGNEEEKKYSVKISNSVSGNGLNIHVTGCNSDHEAKELSIWFCNLCNFLSSIVSTYNLKEEIELYLSHEREKVTKKVKYYFDLLLDELENNEEQLRIKINSLTEKDISGKISTKGTYLRTFTANYNMDIGRKTRKDMIFLRNYFLEMGYKASYDPLIGNPLILVDDETSSLNSAMLYSKGSAYLCMSSEEEYPKIRNLITESLEALIAYKEKIIKK